MVGGRTISVISDGSEESEMRANGRTETYSERAVADFKLRTKKCINITIILFAVLLFYFLFVPSAKFTKVPRGVRNRGRKIKKAVEDTADIMEMEF